MYLPLFSFPLGPETGAPVSIVRSQPAMSSLVQVWPTRFIMVANGAEARRGNFPAASARPSDFFSFGLALFGRGFFFSLPPVFFDGRGWVSELFFSFSRWGRVGEYGFRGYPQVSHLGIRERPAQFRFLAGTQQGMRARPL